MADWRKKHVPEPTSKAVIEQKTMIASKPSDHPPNHLFDFRTGTFLGCLVMMNCVAVAKASDV